MDTDTAAHTSCRHQDLALAEDGWAQSLTLLPGSGARAGSDPPWPALQLTWAPCCPFLPVTLGGALILHIGFPPTENTERGWPECGPLPSAFLPACLPPRLCLPSDSRVTLGESVWKLGAP